MRIKINFWKARKIILSVFAAIAIFAGGYFLGVKGFQLEVTKSLQVSVNKQVPPQDKNVDFSLFWQVWDKLNSDYYDKSKLDSSKMIYGAIQGMVSAIGDPYTMFLPPAQDKIVDDDLSGSFEGVGIEIGYKDSHMAVIAPLPDSPAEKAGVKAGDYITHISDSAKGVNVDTTNISLGDAVSDIRGAAGTNVILTLIRDGQANPITVTLTRAKLVVPSVTLTWVGKDSDIAHIVISEFGSTTTDEWSKAITTVLQKQNTKGIIIDLRNNPGGYLQSAVDIASDFVPVGTTVVIQQTGDGTKTDYKSQTLPRLENYKTVVLINGGSASASEILSGALRDDRGIKLIGEKSFGKGTIQEPVEISGGSGLHVTTAKWLTPKGTWVHGVGLTPDITIVVKDTDTTDTQLSGAINTF
jgi:carboxyl-terminal processing protease